ncbi:MAG: hypothetical protein A2359_03520 [Candidatus Moranbacteria bacterium RIFOXYB1_FULL_43_19]|nr:MAG: hypothetical protein A2359_03520 [Candidatus Moranbacteria bacterium RIFOXYB1_FULL_43_19]OGI27907.1 MAG: hypothetical protein A2184_02715 [Candidatus Moranbacteria bacterium RIFOXYA1_FULL_44_7]OGI32522.1 MAG: hypothetical protein A2420_03015 [Candidatus Moranbacteria bacterium RIFOXYC1_FULL_44_13]OGI38143.1 MAG: hypothetical protein A2612_01300 [Candidatus Moranbacteria bacterium RIFOXYD1_FULL_44_12]
MEYLVCLIFGVMEGTNSETTEFIKNQIKQLIRTACGFQAEKMIVLFQQPLRFMDSKEGVFCEVRWPKGSVPQFEPKNLKEAFEELFKENFGTEKVRVDFKT